MTVVVGYIPDAFGEAALEAGVEEAARRLTDLDWPHQLRRAVGPDMAEILTVVRETDAQLVVIGIRHRTPVGKMIMGSVAQQVLLDAPCPVRAVKPSGAT